MKLKRNIALLAVVLLLGSWAFADTYQYTVTYSADGPFPGGGVIQFTSNSLQPSSNNPGDVTALSTPAGWFLANYFQAFPSNINVGQLAAVSVVWDLSANNGQTFDNIILYNNAYGDWALGTYAIQGNSSFNNSGVNGTITVQDITTPEPTSLALLGSGFIALAGSVRRKLVR